ncbi:retrotransposon protein [Gossypium australe]|uniref:Retrotransposon protein n=1 Tax=Gossypium australe TaxID=47621 RepID=A0A5B6WG84_9ROSI|nr:retrotransposon protein [Gossypium australe]
MAQYEALYGRKCRTPLYWTGLSEKKIHGVVLIKEIEEKKSYTNLKRREIEFQVGSRVFLKVIRFSYKGKLSPFFIGLYEVIERIGPAAYRRALPLELEKMHNVFTFLCYVDIDLIRHM